MDKLLEQLRPSLPSWLITPAILIALFLLAWPTLRDVWQEVVPSRRAHSSEKRRLELLKLRFEVEELKIKFPDVRLETEDQSVTETEHEGGALSSTQAMLYGAIGGFVAGLYPRISAVTFLGSEAAPTLAYWVGAGAFLMITSFMGGLVSRLLNPRTRRDAIIYGAITPLISQLLATGLVGPSDRIKMATHTVILHTVGTAFP